MQVASRTTRRYITPAVKDTSGNNRSKNIKPSNVPFISYSSPKKIVDTSTTKSNQPLTLKNRFHLDESQTRPEHDSINSDFSWLHDQLKNTSCFNNDDDECKSNLPEFIEVFPSTDIDQDLNKRASLLLNQTFSAHSSDIGQISSTGIGSTMTTTTIPITTIVHEQAARPSFTRIIDPKMEYKTENGEDDILYQWRLRRRLEQAQNGEPIIFPSKVSNRSNISPSPSLFPSIPIEIPTVISPSIVLPSSPKKEQQQRSSSTTNTELIITPIPIREYSEASTQTLQDACIQTSLILSTTPVISNEGDLHPTHDDHQHSSVWHRPPIQSKCEITRISSPVPVKRHHHTFHPVVIDGHSTIINNLSNTVQSSQESTLTQVTSIMINENHQIENNNNIAINEIQDNEEIDDDDILNILKQKRNELLIQFQEIEQCLANMIS